MAKFLCSRAIQAFGQIYPENTIITLNEAEIAREIALGINPTTKKPLSPVFNHCSPVDQEAEDAVAQFYTGKEKPKQAEKPKEADEKAEIAKLRGELEVLEVGYDRKWGISKLKEELIKAKKRKGL